MMKHSAAHPGFKAEKAKLAKRPGIRNAGAVLAAGARKASAAAKRANPRLARVK
jgi:hypothetical protein